MAAKIKKGQAFKTVQGKVTGRRERGGPFDGPFVGDDTEQSERKTRRVRTARRPRELKEPSPGTPARNLNDDPGDPRDNPVVFHAYQPTSDVGPKKNTNAADLSGGASEENVVMITGNWFCDFSVDGGLNYKRVSPPSFFTTPLAGGFCCDQIMIFVPGLNRFVWLMQHDTDANGSGAFRLAMASPADIKNDFSTAWTFWDFIADDFNLKGVWLDFPDMAYTDEFLHITIDAVERGGTLIVRIPLKEMALGGTINFRFNNPDDSKSTTLCHLVQSAQDRAIWAGHIDNTTVQLFTWLDSSTSYSSASVKVATWPNGALVSKGPNGNNWLGRAGNSILGGVRSGDHLRLAWTASDGQGGGAGFKFPNAHVRVAEIDLNTNVTLGEMQVWNNDYAFAYPSLNVNAKGEIGIMVGWGGKANDANTASGIIGDFVVWYQDGSTFTNSRWGDYISARKTQRNSNLFAGFGYFTKADPGDAAGWFAVPYYVLFGR